MSVDPRSNTSYVDRKPLSTRHDAATHTEHELWAQLSGCGQGRLTFNKDVWDKWTDAVRQTNAASDAWRQARTNPGSPDPK